MDDIFRYESMRGLHSLTGGHTMETLIIRHGVKSLQLYLVCSCQNAEITGLQEM